MRETSFANAGPGRLASIPPPSSALLLPFSPSGEIADFFPPTPVPSFLLVLAVANAPARSLLLQPLLPDPLWSTDRTVEKDTRAVANNEAIAVPSNLRSTPISQLSRHDSSPFVQRSSPFVLLLNHGEANIQLFVHSLLFEPRSVSLSPNGVPCFQDELPTRGFARSRDIAAMRCFLVSPTK